MAFKFFVVPIRNSEVAESELNGFLRKHTVLSLDRRWVDQGSNSFWSFCIDYLDPTSRDGKGGGAGRQASRVDYREVLPERDFALFTRLRDLRKEIAQAEGVPVYTVFNNDQLAQIVQKRARSKAELEAILVRCRAFLGQSLQLQLKPVPYINRTSHGVDFLGCRVFPDRVILNRRSRVRFHRKMFRLEEQYLRGELDEQELQERATSLVAFTRAAGARSWHFRQSVLERLPVSGRRPPTG